MHRSPPKFTEAVVPVEHKLCAQDIVRTTQCSISHIIHSDLSWKVEATGRDDFENLREIEIIFGSVKNRIQPARQYYHIMFF